MTTHRIWAYDDNVNTDVIFPGKYTYTLKTQEEIAAHALEDLDPTFAANTKPGDVIVAGKNWGVGSSREQAVTALKYVGVNVIIAASFGGLYFRNCINQGVLPVVCPDIRALVKTGDTLELDVAAATIMVDGQTFSFPRLSPSVQAIYDKGGLLEAVRARFK